MSEVQPWALLTAGIIGVVAAAGIFIYEHFSKERQRVQLLQDITRLDDQVSTMRLELENLKKLQKQKNETKTKLRRRRMLKSNESLATEKSFATAAGTEGSSEDEFYDLTSSSVSDDETITEDLEDTIRKFIEIDEKLNGDEFSVRSAQSILQTRALKDPDNFEVLWRLAKSYHKLFECASTTSEKLDLIAEGLGIAERALEQAIDRPQAHKWMAILIGSRASLHQNTGNKISDGNLFKKHLETAIRLDPQDHSLHYLLGRLKYEVAGLTWFERTAAAAIYSEPPQATYQEAIECLMKAENLSPIDWKEPKLILAKCHIAEGNYGKALEWLDKAKNIPAVSAAEKNADVDINVLLNKYQSYR